MNHLLSGLQAWLVQRLSAVYMAIFTLATVITLLMVPISGYQDWLALMSQPLVAGACALFVIALLLHAWIGIRDVILDYVTNLGIRLLLLSLLGAWLMLLALWAIRILLRVTT